MISQGHQNVVSLSGFRKDMKFPCISAVRAYWEGLRDGRLVPYRSEVDPRGIESALEYAFVLERVAPQVARFRLAGVHLNALMGMEVRGMPLTAFFTPDTRPRITDLLEEVFTGPRTAELSLVAAPAKGSVRQTAKLLILPLRSDLGDISRALGCLVSDGPNAPDPSRFELAGCRVEPILAIRATTPVPHTPASGFAEAAAAYTAPPRVEKRSRSHLKLVVSDD